MTNRKLQNLVSDLAKFTDSKNTFSTSLVANKLKNAATIYPKDKTINLAAIVIADLADKKALISRKEIKDLGQLYWDAKSQWKTVMAHELGESVAETQEVEAKKEASAPAQKISFNTTAQDLFTELLEARFAAPSLKKVISQELAQESIKKASTTVAIHGYKVKNLKIADHNDHFIIVEASFETLSGPTSVLLPVEIINNQIGEFSAMVSNDGPSQLNRTTLAKTLENQGGHLLKVSSNVVLKALSGAFEIKKGDDSVKLAALKVAQQGASSIPFNSGMILGQKVEEITRKDIQMPEINDPAFTSLAEQFSSPYERAAFTHGKNKVDLSRNLIQDKLANIGFNTNRIKVSKHTPNSITFVVSLNNSNGFTVPVKVAQHKILTPEVVVADGAIFAFSRDGINQLCDQTSDSRAVAATLPQANMSVPQLVQNVRTACLQGKMDVAQESLQVLANRQSMEAYKFALDIYKQSLGGTLKTASQSSGCKKQFKIASSSVPHCAHTGLPINKVHQDTEGYCVPNYRHGNEETEAAIYLASDQVCI